MAGKEGEVAGGTGGAGDRGARGAGRQGGKQGGSGEGDGGGDVGGDGTVGFGTGGGIRRPRSPAKIVLALAKKLANPVLVCCPGSGTQ